MIQEIPTLEILPSAISRVRLDTGCACPNIQAASADGNQGGAGASNVQITFTLPAGVTFVSASIPPASQSPARTWNVSNLAAKSGPSTITVTARVAADVPIPSTLNHSAGVQTSSTELETLNNTQPVATFIQPFLIYLPLVQR